MRPIAHSLEYQIRSAVCETLRTCPNGLESQEQLIKAGFKQKVDDLAAENELLLVHLEREGKPKAAVINSPNVIHYALLVGSETETLGLLSRAVESTDGAKHFPHAGVWKNYVAALSKYLRHETCNSDIGNPKGYEKHIAPYIHFMNASSLEHEELARAEIEKSFSTRNSDRRCRDAYGLDGDGERPVNWDFRLFTLNARPQLK